MAKAKKQTGVDKKMLATAAAELGEQKVTIDDVKQVMSTLVNDFIKAEAGNRVTENNMAGLTMKLMAACDGHITLTPPDQPA